MKKILALTTMFGLLCSSAMAESYKWDMAKYKCSGELKVAEIVEKEGQKVLKYDGIVINEDISQNLDEVSVLYNVEKDFPVAYFRNGKVTSLVNNECNLDYDIPLDSMSLLYVDSLMALVDYSTPEFNFDVFHVRRMSVDEIDPSFFGDLSCNF